nr:hypothetical protein [Tanacetum cinerariifolium]
MLLCKQEEAGIQLNAEQADWRDDTDDDELEDQELEAHYMYMVQLQEVSPDATDHGPICDAEPLQKVSTDDHYNVFAFESEHFEQSESVHDTYPIGKDEHNVIIDSLDISYDREQIDQNDDDNDLANEREIEDFKNKNKSLESSNNRFKEANNKLSETNNLLYTDFKKSQAELVRHNDVENSKESFNKQTTLLENRMDESILWDQKCKSSIELFKKSSVGTIFDGVERCKETIAKRTYFGHIDPFIKNTIEANFSQSIRKINAGLEQFHVCLNEAMVADLRYFNSLELEVDFLRSQLETQKTQFLNDIDRLSKEYYYADHMNAILGVYTELDEVTNLQCDYLELLEKCECLEKELSKSKIMSKSFEALQKHAINLEIDLQQCKEKIKNDKSLKENQSKEFRKEREQYYEIQDLKAQLQDKGIVIRVIPTTSVSRP